MANVLATCYMPHNSVHANYATQTPKSEMFSFFSAFGYGSACFGFGFGFYDRSAARRGRNRDLFYVPHLQPLHSTATVVVAAAAAVVVATATPLQLQIAAAVVHKRLINLKPVYEGASCAVSQEVPQKSGCKCGAFYEPRIRFN